MSKEEIYVGAMQGGKTETLIDKLLHKAFGLKWNLQLRRVSIEESSEDDTCEKEKKDE